MGRKPEKPDIKAACDLIRDNRLRAKRTLLRKNVGVCSDIYEKGQHVFMYCYIRIHKNSKNIVLAHSLRWYRKDVYSKTNQKLRCINQHGLDELNKHRERRKLYSKRNYHNKIRLYNYLGNNIHLTEEMFYNSRTGAVAYNSFFTTGWHGLKLKIIDDA